MFFPILVSVLFSKTPYLLILVGGIGGKGEIKIASASTPSANEQAKDVVLVQVISGADRHLDITFGLQVQCILTYPNPFGQENFFLFGLVKNSDK